jgi:hypothetical protein
VTDSEALCTLVPCHNKVFGFQEFLCRHAFSFSSLETWRECIWIGFFSIRNARGAKSLVLSDGTISLEFLPLQIFSRFSCTSLMEHLAILMFHRSPPLITLLSPHLFFCIFATPLCIFFVIQVLCIISQEESNNGLPQAMTPLVILKIVDFSVQ